MMKASKHMHDEAGSTTHVYKVWDLATRLFHWTLVILVAALYISAETNNAVIHRYLGLAVLTLLLFRICLGFIGSDSSRFAGFIKGPDAVFNYLRNLLSKGTTSYAGHNPVGGLMVVTIITLLTVAAISGLFADDGCVTHAPLGYLVTLQASDLFTFIHHVCTNVILILVALHILAAFFYLIIKRQNLIWSLVTGKKFLQDSRVDVPRLVSPWMAMSVLVLSGTAVWLLFIVAQPV